MPRTPIAFLGACLLAGVGDIAQAQTNAGPSLGNSILPGLSSSTGSSPNPTAIPTSANMFNDWPQGNEPCMILNDPDPRRCGFYGGGGFYLLKPFMQNNTAAVITIAPGTPNSLVTQESFNWHFQPAAAFWLGWASESGLGVQARYFFFNQDSQTSLFSNSITPAPATQTTITPPLGNFLPLSTGGTSFGSPGTVLNSGLGTDKLAFSSSLNINAVDIEATYGWHGNGWSLLASGGGRYLSLDQDYQARLVNNAGGLPLSESQVLNSIRNFSGGGLVAGLLGNADLGRTGFSLYGSLRGSFVVGTTSESVRYNQTVNDPTGLIPPGIPGTLSLSPQSVRNTDHTISTIELELGIQYTHRFSWGDVLFRAAAVNQTYFDAGNASVSTGNLSLLGVQWSAGLRY